MNTLGNIFWLIFGGILIAFYYFLGGILLCITIIGIPFGLQLFKLGAYVLLPFGRELSTGKSESGCLPLAMNIIWLLIGGWEIALMHLFFGLLFCITIVGIPLGLKHFKIIPGALLPFGREIVKSEKA